MYLLYSFFFWLKKIDVLRYYPLEKNHCSANDRAGEALLRILCYSLLNLCRKKCEDSRRNKMSLLTRDGIHTHLKTTTHSHTLHSTVSREQREFVHRRVYIYTHTLLRSLGMSHQCWNLANVFGRISLSDVSACEFVARREIAIVGFD